MLRQDDVYTLRWRTLRLVLAPIGVFIASDLAFRYLGPAGLGAFDTAMPERLGYDGAARLYFLSALVAFAAAAVLAVLLFANDFAWTYGPKVRVRLAVGMAAGIFLAWAYQKTSFFLHLPEKHFGLDAIELKGLLTPAQCAKSSATPAGSSTYLCTLVDVAYWVNVLLLPLQAMLIAGAGSCLAAPLDSLDDAARRIAVDRQQRRLQGYVTCAATLLVSGLLLELVYTRWPLAIMGQAKSIAAYAAYVDALALYFGVTYSAMIASYAVPVAVRLQMRRAGLSLAPGEIGERPGLFDNGLIDALGKIATVMAPALIGALPMLLDLIKK